MKAQYLFLSATLLVFGTGHTNADKNPSQSAPAAAPLGGMVQASPDRPDSTRKGSVTGTVVDEQGKAIDKARVELTDTVTKELPIVAITDSKGHYIFNNLLPGTYTVQAKVEGMESVSTGIKVTNGRNNGPKLILRASKL